MEYQSGMVLRKSAFMGASSVVISFGIGSAATSAFQETVSIGKSLFEAGMHAYTGGIMSALDGGNFGAGALSGAISSMMASSIQGLGTDFGASKASGRLVYNNFGKDLMKTTMIVTGGLSGGISVAIAGGNFWDGFKQGIITAGLNHVGHMVADGLGGDRLRKEFDGTELDPDKKATFCDWEVLVEKIKSLKYLFGKTGSKFIATADPDAPPGKWIDGSDKILINVNKTGTLLDYAYTLGHEMYHHFDAIFIYSDVFKVLGSSGPISQNVRKLYSEYRAYSWELKMGNNVNPSAMVKEYASWLGKEDGPAALNMLNSKLDELNAALF